MTVVGRAENLDAGNHSYTHPVTGRHYPSVTRIISASNDSSRFLTPWAAKLAATWSVEHLELVSMTAREAGKGAAVDLIAGRAGKLRKVAADVGSYCHHVIESLILDLPLLDIPEELLGQDYDGEPLTQDLVDVIVEGFFAFVSDFDVEFEFAEITVCNRRLDYAGTLDIGALVDLGRMGRLRLDIDAKTGKHLKQTMVAQQAAYTDPANEVWLPNGQIVPLPPFDGAGVLHLRREYSRGYKLFYVRPEMLAEGREWFAVMRSNFAHQERMQARPGRVIYPPQPDGSQPPPLLEDIEGYTKQRNLLLAEGYRTLAQIREHLGQLLDIKGFGPKSLDAVHAMLDEHAPTATTESDRTVA